MKKIGIITFHFVENSGAILQCLGLKLYLEKMGYDVYFINYIPRSLKRRNSLFVNPIRIYLKHRKNLEKRQNIAKSIYYSARSVFSNIFILRKFRVRRIFKKFRLNNFKITKEVYSLNDFKQITEDFDYIISGSDQIWNSELLGGELDPMYFIDFVSKAKKITFAASAGDILKENDLPLFKKFKNNLDQISVREKDLATQIETNFDFKTKVIPDPTILLLKDDWGKLITNHKARNQINENYVFVYSLENSPLLYNYSKFVADKLNLKIVELGFRKRIKNSILITKYDSIDFLDLILNSTYIVTNSFHGTIFSIILEKQFTSIKHSTRNKRIENILHLTGLESRMISQIDSNINDSIIDYNNLRDDVDKLRKIAIKYLENNLNV
jgi:hypothetical protein